MLSIPAACPAAPAFAQAEHVACFDRVVEIEVQFHHSAFQGAADLRRLVQVLGHAAGCLQCRLDASERDRLGFDFNVLKIFFR